MFKLFCLYRPNKNMVKTVNEKMKWFRERRSCGGARVLFILLLLALKTVGKETIIFLAFQRGSKAPMPPLATSLHEADDQIYVMQVGHRHINPLYGPCGLICNNDTLGGLLISYK